MQEGYLGKEHSDDVSKPPAVVAKLESDDPQFANSWKPKSKKRERRRPNFFDDESLAQGGPRVFPKKKKKRSRQSEKKEDKGEEGETGLPLERDRPPSWDELIAQVQRGVVGALKEPLEKHSGTGSGTTVIQAPINIHIHLGGSK